MVEALLLSFVIAAALQEAPAAASPQPVPAPPAKAVPCSPETAKRGELCSWQSADGLKYEYFVPVGYDPAVGANLTLVLHGTGLDESWTFLNHPPGRFRPADIVVSPDGTTFKEYTQHNEFLGESADARRVHELLEELKDTWKVKQTFLYGHSNGSFFVFYFAGAFPDDVDGVCGHSSGVWNWTTMGSKGRRVAIGLMHGTVDPLVPYDQSWWGRKVYREAKYPLVHLRTLFDWSHQPAWPQAELQLAWCEGMTSSDPARLEACLATLGAPDVPLGTDWAALWAVADRLANDKSASDSQRARGAAVAQKVTDLAGRHIAAIEAPLGKEGTSALKKLKAGPSVGHLIRFLEDFDGVPPRDAWVEKNKAVTKNLADSAQENYAAWWRTKDTDKEEALAAALDLLETGYTQYDLPRILGVLEKWAKGDSVKFTDGQRQQLAEQAEIYRSGRKSGFAEYEQLNGEVQPLE